jgi:hypothetical protein
MVRLHDLIGERKRTVDAGHSIVQNNVSLLTHGAQNLAASQRRSDCVAIGPGVRRQHKSFVLSNLTEYVRQ